MKALTKALRAEKKKDFSTMVRDADGEKHVKAIGAQLASSKGLYQDPQFTPDPKMLFHDPAHPAPYMESIKEKLDQGKIKWLRPNEMGNVEEKFQVFAQGIEPEDINQGAIGDCYFLAALAICATREELINDLIVEDCAEQGIYGVKFYYEGKWVTVVVDDLFPCWQVGSQWLPIFCKWKGEKETWAMVAEKAWAKLHGSYEAIDGGRTEDALGYLSGGCTIATFFKDRDDKQIAEIGNGKLFQKLVSDHRSNGRDMGCFMSASGVQESASSKKGHDNPDDVAAGASGLVSGHAYSVLDIREVEGHQLIQLRNPWGNFEWGGDWSDNSPLWTPSLKKAVDFVAADDGSFWMSFKDFTTQYSQVGVCKTIPSSWHSKLKHSKWKAPEFAGGPNEVLAHFNPTFELKNENPQVWIQFEQPDQRKTQGDWLNATFRVLRKPANGQVDINDCITSVNLSERTRTVELDLDPTQGPYLILATAWAPGIEGEFYLAVHSPGKLDLDSIPSEKPSAAEAALMAPVVFPKSCCGCSKPIVGFDKRSTKGFQFHSACYKCADCNSTDVFDVGKENGKWSVYCFSCWNPKFGEKCVFCNKSVQVGKSGGEPVASIFRKGKLHLACREPYKQAELLRLASTCFYCNQKIVTGEYYQVDGKGDIHPDCNAQWKLKNAPKCIQCGEAIANIPGKFTGEYFPLSEGDVHVECQSQYNRSKAKKCLQCSMALLTIEGKFSGRFLPVKDSGVHEECLVAYKSATAEKCFFCQQPACEIPGKFSGNFYEIDNKGKLHEECYSAWKAKK